MKIRPFILGTIIVVLLQITSCGDNLNNANSTQLEKGEKKTLGINVKSVKTNDFFEFHKASIINECKDPFILKVKFIDNSNVKVSSWTKGCPNNIIREEELMYSYRIDKSSNWKQEYDDLTTEEEVLILENPNAGYVNGYWDLSKRFLISNAYVQSEFIAFRIFRQLDPIEYPSRNSVFTSAGDLANK